MKIIVIGASGTIGSKIVDALQQQHDLIRVGKTRGDYQMDISDLNSIRQTLEQIGPVDAVINASGDVAFNGFSQMSQEQWQLGINSKMMGQINLVREAIPYLNPNGSITLTSGVLTDEFIAGGSSASAINAAVDHFAQSVATELPNGIRINVVSPGMLEESQPVFGDFFPGFEPVAGSRVALAYVKSTLGVMTGRIFKVV